MKSAKSKETGAAATATGLRDAKAVRPALSFIFSLVPIPEDILSAWAKACRSRPDLFCFTSEALRQGGEL